MSVQKLLNPDFIGDDLIEELKAAKPDWTSRLRHSFNAVAKIFKPEFPVTVHYLSDNGGYPDTAKIEIKKRLRDINAILSTLSGRSAPETEYHDIPSQDWRAGAFDLAQITRDSVRGPGNVVFLNCAPRRKERGNKADNEGEGVYIGMLRNGTIISAVSEDSFSLFRDLIEKGDLEIYRAGVQIKGSQFRSRDYFPWLSQMIANNLQGQSKGWQSDLSVEERRAFLEKLNFVKTDQVLDINHITDFKAEPCVLRADCHGNLKLSLREADIEALGIPLNTAIKIKIGDETHIAALKKGMFDPNRNTDVGLAFGSSGNWADSRDGRFLELALMGKSLRDDWGITDQQLKEGVSVDIIDPTDNVEVLRQPKGGDQPKAARA
ncbi:MAG TPA: hypothetical protein PLF01_00300 [Alphaproteobacteria bacterium]|nr:hypothetical protein [Alphaproteobacteria bacterium]